LKSIKLIPLHPIFFSIYSLLALLARNFQEVEVSILIRPLLISLVAGAILYAGLYLLFRNWEKAALLCSYFLILFTTYGHVYQFFETVPGLNLVLGRHRYLVFIYLVALAAGLWLIIAKIKTLQPWNVALNAVGLVMVAIPLTQIGYAILQGQQSRQASQAASALAATLTPSDLKHLPDVYFIVLDGYTRQDALQRDLGFDNSFFVDGLRSQGFYVADCSRSNYSYTQASITSALNLDYLSSLSSRLAQLSPPTNDVFVLLKRSLVREQLENLGYQTVAFETGYEWSRLADADIYMSMTKDPYSMQQAIRPFEAMYLKSTALLLVTDLIYRTREVEFRNPNYPFSDHVERQRFILDQLPRLTGYSDQPKFVFAHVLIPHVPYVFGPDGEVVTDPGYYSGLKAGPVNDTYRAKGYTNQVAYISKAMLKITAEILANSPQPPVIVIMGDHGLQGDNRLLILNAYYMPDGDSTGLYPGITPVNSFRIIFNRFFGGQYERLDDLSWYVSDGKSVLVEDSNPTCHSK
jgi:hypothetical protein